MALQPISHCIHRNLGGGIQRIAIHARRNCREGDAVDVVGLCQLQRTAVAVRQLHGILRGARVDGAHRMDDILRLQPVAPCDLRFASAAAMQGAALGKQLRPCCPVNGSIHATAAQQAAVSRIHDAVTVQLGNVSLHYLNLIFYFFRNHCKHITF